MSREQIAAALIASAVGLIAYEYRRYRFWGHWSRPALVAGIISFALLNGLVGYLTALIAEATDWAPGGEQAWLTNALVFAGLGEMIPRTLLRGTGNGPVDGRAPSSAKC